jgi:hypothetical protein
MRCRLAFAVIARNEATSLYVLVARNEAIPLFLVIARNEAISLYALSKIVAKPLSYSY